MYCKYCGKEIGENAKFCTHCGKPIVTAVESAKKEAIGENAVKGGGAGTIKYLVVAIVVCIGIAGLLAFVCWNKDMGSRQKEIELPDEQMPLLAYDPIEKKYGYKNIKNEWVIFPEYDEADFFTNQGLAIVKQGDRHYLINRQGAEVCEIYLNGANYIRRIWNDAQTGEYINFEDFGPDNIIAVEYTRNASGYGFEEGFLDENGHFEELGENFSLSYRNKIMEKKGLYCAYTSNDRKYGYMTAEKEEVIPFVYDSLGTIAENGLICAEINDKWGFLDENGNIVIAMRYDGAGSFQAGNLAPVRIDDKWGYINEEGEEVISPQYDYACEFEENGLACVCKEGEYGYIDDKGKEVIPVQYERATDFNSNQIVAVCEDGKWGCMDEEGKEIIPLEYDEIDIGFGLGEYGWHGGCYKNIYMEDMIAVCKDGKWGCVNKKNKTILPLEYDACRPFAGELLAVAKDDFSELRNCKGETLVNLDIVRDIEYIGQHGLLYFFDTDDGCFYIDNAGNILLMD